MYSMTYRVPSTCVVRKALGVNLMSAFCTVFRLWSAEGLKRNKWRIRSRILIEI